MRSALHSTFSYFCSSLASSPSSSVGFLLYRCDLWNIKKVLVIFLFFAFFPPTKKRTLIFNEKWSWKLATTNKFKSPSDFFFNFVFKKFLSLHQMENIHYSLKVPSNSNIKENEKTLVWSEKKCNHNHHVKNLILNFESWRESS